MTALETDNQVYLFYKFPNNSNEDSPDALKAHLKVSEMHNVAVGDRHGLPEE